MAVVTALNQEVQRPSPRANPDRKEIRSGLDSTFVPGRRRAHTATGALDPSECYGGFMHTNEGAAGAVQLNLPEARAGMEVQFVALAAQTITINPQDSEQIEVLTNAAGDSVNNATTPIIGDRIALQCVEDGVWLPLVAQAVGDWADAN